MGRELGMEDTGLDSIRAANHGLISQTVKLRSIGVREATQRWSPDPYVHPRELACIL